MDSLRPLGHTDIQVSAIGLGTVKIGRNRDVKYPTPFELPTDDQVVSLLRAANDLGVNLIDTAPAYGVSEERLGQLMKQHHWFGGRDRWILSTKVGEEFDERGSRFDFSAEHIRASVERSLRRLHTDVLDIVLIHSDGNDDRVLRESGAVDALLALKRRGVVRAIGISTKTVDGAMLAIRIGLDVIMVTLNAADLTHIPVIEDAGRAGVGVLIKKALVSGHAASADGVHDAMKLIFTQTTGAVSSAVVGTLNPKHLRDNVEAAQLALRERPTTRA